MPELLGFKVTDVLNTARSLCENLAKKTFAIVRQFGIGMARFAEFAEEGE
jgi:hypothetical protein